MLNQQSMVVLYRWWVGELKSLVPAGVRDWFLTREGNVALELGNTQVTVSRYDEQSQGKIEREILSLAEHDDEHMAQRIMRGFDVRMTRVILRLSANQVLRKVISVPAALEENLKEAVSYDIDRHTPFQLEQVYFDVAVVARQEEKNTLSVLLAVVAKKNVTQLMAQIERWGLAVDSVQMAGTRMPKITGAENFSPEFVSEAHAPKKNRTKGHLNIAAVGVVLMLFAAVLVYPLVQQQAVLSQLRADISSSQKEAKIATETRNQLDRIVEEANFIVKKKREVLSALSVLNALTRLLPNDSYLSLLEMKNNLVRIQGQSVAASNLIGYVEQSPLFQGAKFNGQLTKDRRTGLQRFYLTTNLVAKDVPE